MNFIFLPIKLCLCVTLRETFLNSYPIEGFKHTASNMLNLGGAIYVEAAGITATSRIIMLFTGFFTLRSGFRLNFKLRFNAFTFLFSRGLSTVGIFSPLSEILAVDYERS